MLSLSFFLFNNHSSRLSISFYATSIAQHIVLNSLKNQGLAEISMKIIISGGEM